MPGGGGGQAPRRARAIAALAPVAAQAEALGIRMGIENHWGITARPEGILEILRGVGSPVLGTCPDLGNIPAGLAAEAVLAALVPQAVLLHAKYPVGLRGGEGGWRELARRWEVCRRAGYRGPVTLEYEGWGDPWPACGRMASLVRKTANG
jgi:sugar phosphate isomerase/epimerase